MPSSDRPDPAASAPAPASPSGGSAGQSGGSGGVQSLERAFDLLERMADAGGEVGLSELSGSSGLPLPTIHRLMRTLVACGYVRQHPNRRYALGPRLIRLGESSSRLLGTWARPYLARLVEETGETANMALLDGDEVVYVAQVPSRHSMRMFTEVGRRVLPHSTGVGKALLADTAPDQVRALLARTGMPAATERTITTPDGFLAALEHVREAGYATDDNEQELGVRCIAVSVPDSPTAAAISISGPAGRVTEAATEKFVPLMHEVAEQLSKALASSGANGTNGTNGTNGG
ncbi:IclR family transcriptional regulator [Streptomyces nanshensis]|uniref:IclR family transcriptional regulator n=1 Tax=Streptomyces nanshensis TaxID=518642 RepID=A0A1E7KGM0_9ACTN|nr:IclR family transcriptional regulator [Streptomyces nanshensis]OEV03065.1 IclR family transcriptional regulator [Streptomyces nanshensis]